jgi:hypothetical protein
MVYYCSGGYWKANNHEILFRNCRSWRIRRVGHPRIGESHTGGKGAAFTMSSEPNVWQVGVSLARTAAPAPKMHDFDNGTNAWGIIIGASRCRRCGVLCRYGNLNERSCLGIDGGTV